MTERPSNNLNLPDPGEQLTPSVLLRMAGGWIGLAESVLPPLAFSAVFTLTQSGEVSVITAVTLTALFLGYRLLRRQPLSGVLLGLAGTGLAAFLALREGGQTLDYFVPGFFTNGAYGVALLLSIVVGRPLLGYVIAFVRGASDWRSDRSVRRLAHWLTWLWVAFFALRLAVQLPLYFAENLQLLAASRALLGTPAYVGLLALTWLIIRPSTASKK